MSNTTQELQRLEQQIDEVLERPEEDEDRSVFEGLIQKHGDLLRKALVEHQNGGLVSETGQILKNSHHKLELWIKKATEEREETRKSLLHLVQGRRARDVY